MLFRRKAGRREVRERVTELLVAVESQMSSNNSFSSIIEAKMGGRLTNKMFDDV